MSQSVTIGRCIYCGATDGNLTREHVIPAGLNGEMVLHEASCTDCAQITSAFERDVLRRMLGFARVTLGLRTRRKGQRARVIPIEINHGWGWRAADAGVLRYPAMIPLPVFAPPARVTGKILPPSVALEVRGITAVILRQRPARIAALPGTRIRLKYNPTSFARMLAKIAYGVSVAEFGLHAFAEVYVVPLILGRRMDAAEWVGTSGEVPKNREPMLHSVVTQVRAGEVHAWVRLFGQFGGGEYHVVVGRLKTGTGDLMDGPAPS